MNQVLHLQPVGLRYLYTLQHHHCLNSQPKRSSRTPLQHLIHCEDFNFVNFTVMENLCLKPYTGSPGTTPATDFHLSP